MEQLSLRNWKRSLILSILVLDIEKWKETQYKKINLLEIFISIRCYVWYCDSDDLFISLWLLVFKILRLSGRFPEWSSCKRVQVFFRKNFECPLLIDQCAISIMDWSSWERINLCLQHAHQIIKKHIIYT